MPDQTVTSPEGLDADVAWRQAFGAVYSRPARVSELTELVLGGHVAATSAPRLDRRRH